MLISGVGLFNGRVLLIKCRGRYFRYGYCDNFIIVFFGFLKCFLEVEFFSF